MRRAFLSLFNFNQGEALVKFSLIIIVSVLLFTPAEGVFDMGECDYQEKL